MSCPPPWARRRPGVRRCRSAGPPVGGVLFGLGRAVPFVVDIRPGQLPDAGHAAHTRRRRQAPASLGRRYRGAPRPLRGRTLVGSLASPLFRRALSIRAILFLELWTWLGGWLFVAWPNVYALLAILVPFGIAAPVTDSVVIGYTVAMTPDRI